MNDSIVALEHTQGHTHIGGRTPLDEGSARRRDIYLTTHKRQTSMRPAAFEPPVPASERPQTYALDCAATIKPRFSNDRESYHATDTPVVSKC
jgi:hypothetical protein